MEAQSIQKLLIGVACAGFGASAHFFLSGDSKPQPVSQVVASAKRERLTSAVQQAKRTRVVSPKAELATAKARPLREEAKTYTPRDREGSTRKTVKRMQPPAC